MENKNCKIKNKEKNENSNIDNIIFEKIKKIIINIINTINYITITRW